MMKKIFNLTLLFLESFSGRKIIHFPRRDFSKHPVAVKSSYGFWYVGNIFDQADSGYSVLCNGDIERQESKLVLKIANCFKTPFIFYDIGSNTGWYSMLLATHSSKPKVYSFEPILEHLEYQRASKELNFLENISFHLLALSSKPGKRMIRLAGSGTSLEEDFLEIDFGKREVELSSVDHMVEQKVIELPDFVKIDVEGHEYSVLQGALSTIQESTPIFFIEIAKTLSRRKFINQTATKTFDTLSSKGYLSYILSGDLLVEVSLDSMIDGVHMILFLHKDKHIQFIKQLVD